MQPRTTAILFVVAVLLGAFVYLYEIKGEAGREDAAAESRRIFPDVIAGEIDTLEFRTQDDRPFQSVRASDGWLIQRPVNFPGDDVNLDAIASTLANLKSESEIEAAGAPEIYGLGTSAKRIQFWVGEQSYTLEIGADTPVGGNVYVARGGDPDTVYSVALFRVGSFARDLDSLRDRRVLRFDRARVNRVVAGWPGGSVTLRKSEAGWEIVNPTGISGPADAKTVDDLLSDVAFLRAEGFVDHDVDHDVEEDRAAEPYYTLRLGLDEEGLEEETPSETEGHSLEVGFLVLGDPTGADYLVRAGYPGVLYSVPRSRIDGFPRELFSFRFKELSNFETLDVQSFELIFNVQVESNSSQMESVQVDRVATGWQAVGDEWVAGAAAGLIAEFARLEAVSVVADNASDDALAAFGLFPAQVTLRAYDASRELLAEVSLGALDPDAGILAKALGQAVVYRLDAALAEQIPISLDALRARFLVPAVEAAAVEEPAVE